MARRKKSSERIEPVFEKPHSPGRGSARGSNQRGSDKPVAKSAKKWTKNSPSRRKRGRKNGLLGFFGRAFYWSLVASIWIGIAGIGVVSYHAMLLPSTNMWAIPDRPPNAKILATNGELVANRGVTGGAAMGLEEMSPYIPMAVIAIEDHRFKHHFGIDVFGLGRAMAKNISAGRLVQGGSTLTQQLAKNLFLKPERTLSRKIQEAILALWLETRFSKDEILELYLNRVYFGSGSYGVDAASRRYFGKSARDVNLAEAAILAGVLKAPSRLSPARNRKLSDQRAQLVLAAMRREGYISDRESATALTMKAKKAKRYLSGSQHYVADYVMKKIPQLIGELNEDIFIETTIDINLQRRAGVEIASALDDNGKRKKVSQGAMVSLDGTGAVRALVGGREYSESQFNRAVNAKRQPGSAFKPFVYLTALEAGRTPASIRMDAPVKIGKWTPQNYDRKYRGRVSLQDAFAKSLNTVSAQLVMESGPKRVIKTAQRLGINSKMTSNASIALGTSEVSLIELTGAYAPFANGGYGITPYLISRITNAKGKVLYVRKPVKSERVINPREVGMMNQMMRATVESGTGKDARIANWSAAGKTGTSQNFRDGWFIGFTSNLITGVWFGNDDGSATSKVTGGGMSARTWGRYMNFAHRGVPVVPLPGLIQPRLVGAQPDRSPVRPRVHVKQVSSQAISQPETQPSTNIAIPVRRDMRTTSAIRPSGNVGQRNAKQNPRKKPGSILELLFGR